MPDPGCPGRVDEGLVLGDAVLGLAAGDHEERLDAGEGGPAHGGVAVVARKDDGARQLGRLRRVPCEEAEIEAGFGEAACDLTADDSGDARDCDRGSGASHGWMVRPGNHPARALFCAFARGSTVCA